MDQISSSRRAAVLARSEGVQLLWDARECACEVKQDLWQLAVEIGALRQAGLTNTDLRWLLAHGLSSHGEELTRPSDLRRRFSKVKSLALQDNHCFVLSAAGHRFARPQAADPEGCASEPGLETPGYLPLREENIPPVRGQATAEAMESIQPRSDVPDWDASLHELRFRGRIIKRFIRPAPAQEMILSVFQEEGWPGGIDDPLTSQFGQDPKRRLHYTVQNLNRGQRPASLHFFINGNGQLVRWQIINPSRTRRRPAKRRRRRTGAPATEQRRASDGSDIRSSRRE